MQNFQQIFTFSTDVGNVEIAVVPSKLSVTERHLPSAGINCIIDAKKKHFSITDRKQSALYLNKFQVNRIVIN